MIRDARTVLGLALLAWSTDRRRLLGALALMVGQSVSAPLTALALSIVIDSAVRGATGRAVSAGAVAAVLAVLGLIGGHFASVLFIELGESTFVRLDQQLIELSNGSPGMDHHERVEYADRVTVLRQELNRMPWFSIQVILSSVSLALAIATTGVLLATLHPLLLLLPLVAVPSLLTGARAEAVLSGARRRAAPGTRAARHVLDLVTDPATAAELRVGGLRDWMVSRHREQWRAAAGIRWRGELRATALRMAGQLMFGVAYLGATLLVIRRTISGHGSVGDVVLVVMLAVQVNQLMVGGVALLQNLQRLAGTLGEFEWMKRLVTAEGPLPGDLQPPARLREGIVLRDVSFRYPGSQTPVLEHVDLRLPAGATVAVVGENGAGKSTLVKLLCRFYELSSGRIEVDGVDLRRIDVQAWRRRLAGGFQDFARFELPARQTVGVGDLPHVDDDEEVGRALERAAAQQVLDRLPEGLDTPLGVTMPGGRQLSGGQWQRLALGRAMMRQDPLLLVLDEPTAALDAEAEHRLFTQHVASARRLQARTGAVTLLVSHRFSTVRAADLILVISDKGISEMGTHDELMAANGLYAELYQLQARQYSVSDRR